MFLSWFLRSFWLWILGCHSKPGTACSQYLSSCGFEPRY